MIKYSFLNDYSEGAHPAILDALVQTNLVQEEGYGLDSLSVRAGELLRQACGGAQVDIHLVSGGTQANLLCLAAALKPYEAVIAAESGHINVHETGAIEATGHKICAAPSNDGKLRPEQIQAIVDFHTDEHMVRPRVVFISNATEVGTVYTKAELTAIAQCCHHNNLLLHLDGARLGSALCSSESDLTLADVSQLTDSFYIGGTKNGALLGEAIVISNPALQADFRYHIKQRGALLAKGRVLGAQFIALFNNDLYFQLARHANTMAQKLASGIAGLGFGFLAASTTNQIFPILPNPLIDELNKLYNFYVWSKVDDQYSAIRLVTSWATPEDKVDMFLGDLTNLQTSKPS